MYNTHKKISTQHEMTSWNIQVDFKNKVLMSEFAFFLLDIVYLVCTAKARMF